MLLGLFRAATLCKLKLSVPPILMGWTPWGQDKFQDPCAHFCTTVEPSNPWVSGSLSACVAIWAADFVIQNWSKRQRTRDFWSKRTVHEDVFLRFTEWNEWDVDKAQRFIDNLQNFLCVQRCQRELLLKSTKYFAELRTTVPGRGTPCSWSPSG